MYVLTRLYFLKINFKNHINQRADQKNYKKLVQIIVLSQGLDKHSMVLSR
jgi:hypothetical protein